MSEVSTVAVITARPGRGDELEVLLRRLAEGTHAEDGCVLYSLQRGLQDRDVFVTVEKWESSGHLDAHLAGPAVQAALSGAEALLAGAPQIIPAEVLTVGDPAKSAY